MDANKFEEVAKLAIAKKEGIPVESIYTVWLCKTLQNNKGLFSDPRPNNQYFEVTYNGDKSEMYLDKYVKESNDCIKL